MKLTNPEDIALNTAFALEVVGWKTELSGDALLFYNENGAFMGGRNDGQPWSGIPEFTQSADLVLPWLEKQQSWASEKNWNANEVAVHVSDPFPKTGRDKCFAKAAVLALLRAKGVEVEFTT